MLIELNDSQLRERVKFLQTVKPFSKLTEQDLRTIAVDFQERRYPKQTHLFHQQDSSSELHVIKTGKVRVYTEARFNQQTTIVVFRARDIIGEYAIIDNEPRSTAAQTVEKATLLRIERKRFLHHLQTLPALGVGMCELLVSKARWCASYADIMAQYDGSTRFLRLMLLYNKTLGQGKADGERVIDFGLSQTELASLVGINRSTLNRKLNEWAKQGILSFKQKKIVLHDLSQVYAELRALQSSTKRGGKIP